MEKRNEFLEAITAGREALCSLKLANEQLASADHWGIIDLIGGGFFTSMIKHSKLDYAVSYMQDAKQKLFIFQKELKDISVPMEFGVEISCFLSFADYFFDGIISDYLVQSKISESKCQVEEAIRRVEAILFTLEHAIPDAELY